MASDRNVAPVIKRKKIIVEDGHHGGAWKVAYADFVTAMMAFFMLMWLLNATTEKQRKGISDYFSPTAPISRLSSGSDGMFMGDSVFAEDVLPQTGVGASSMHESERDSDGQSADFEKVDDILLGLGGESMEDDNWRRHVVTRVTDEGYVLEFFDTPNEPLFTDGATPTQLLIDVAYAVREVSKLLNNDIAIEAHVATRPVVERDNPAWELTSDQAFAFSRLLTDFGFDEDRLRRVTAFGDREPVTENLMALRNNRIEVIYLRY